MKRRSPAPRFSHPDAPKTLEEARAREAAWVEANTCLECGGIRCDLEPEHRRDTKAIREQRARERTR